MNNLNKPYVTATDRVSSTADSTCEMNVSWSAILMSALASIGLSFLLNLFSMAIGLTVVSTNSMGKGTLAIGGLIGLLIGAIATMFFSGWLAGYIARPSYTNPGVGGIYGFSAWCLALLITILTASYVGKFLVNSSYFLSHSSTVSEMIVDEHDSVSALTRLSVTNNQEMNGDEKPVKTAGISSFVIFILFFVGALSSTVGGYYAGLESRRY